MKKILPTLLLFLSFSITAQNITGKVIDSKTKESIPYVTIVCKSNKDKILSGAITDESGVFKIEKLALQTVIIEIQFIGYKTIKKEIVLTAKNPNKDLGIILLKEDRASLDEVIIESETTSVIQKIDRKVYTIGKDLTAAGTNSLLMLENIPSISVNHQSGQILLRGNGNVNLLIDGKPSNLSAQQLLKQLPSSTVKQVEVITNPSAKYSAEGMSGIINIILKKNTKIGFNGSFDVGVEHSKNTRPTGSVNLNYRIGKVNIYGNYGVDLGKFETYFKFNRKDKDLVQDVFFIDNTTSHFAKAGIDYYINDKNTLSFFTTHNLSDINFTNNSNTYLNQNLILNNKNLFLIDNKEHAYNIDYILDINDKGEQIELEFNYSKNTKPENDLNRELLNPTSKVYNYTNEILNDNSIFLANLDYIKPITSGKLELGLEARIQNTFHNIITDQVVESQGISPSVLRGNSTFSYDRNTYSAYINLNKNYKKVTLQTGLRFENFSVNGLFSNTQQAATEPYSKEFFTVYPSAYLTFKPKDKHQLQIGYSRRVDRPAIDQVTPIQEWTTPLSISVGNRTLEPQFTNSFELNYTRTLDKGNYTLGTFYRRTTGRIGRIFMQDAVNSDRQLLSYGNYDTTDNFGFEFSSSYKPVKWWTIRPSANVYFQENHGVLNHQNVTVKNTLFTARISNSIKASKNLRFQLSSSYRGNNRTIQFKIKPYLLINAAASLSVLNDNGTITLRGTDIFDSFKLDFSSTNPFPQRGLFTLEYSAIYLGFSYNFGSGKNRERDRKYRKNNETQGGVI
ncbi:outer membrane receptor protein involved in Fe transport [Lutibacter sp. Hel_I_33_5]|uniref:outer membrane beta-barrel family protein n=1 Tax=Lutibacter sp. Hel_I_33_5 TaxID=1566289 RepID=UPI00119E1CD8|nr:outer membrane beta-barrel family protein [Lutibacter sp. Hel_I_33_5]TVZ57120.1 outer membrane receptor protein involved in Fe transport [Lutibacter sp. Hel_I_33_5]